MGTAVSIYLGKLAVKLLLFAYAFYLIIEHFKGNIARDYECYCGGYRHKTYGYSK